RKAVIRNISSELLLSLKKTYKKDGARFNQRPFYQLVFRLLHEATNLKSKALSHNVRMSIGRLLLSFNPFVCPAFTFAWIELISHRYFAPYLLNYNDGWP
ncbi:MAG: hypothetical protein CUN54_10995, partial [Phototrophicales bacterium]